jgi:pimeloyl-ACP methyl ester carboxylesterase
MHHQTFKLPDGRTLGFAIYGLPGGWPIVYFHGTPSSRLEILLLNEYKNNIEQYLSDQKVQLIAVDRPGMGLSSFHFNRGFLSFADDVYILLKSLGIFYSSVLCWSGGGPYAFSIAWKYPELIKDVFILCGFSQRFSRGLLRQMGMNKWYFLAAKHTPWFLEFTLNRVRKMNTRLSLPQWLSRLPDIDYNLMKDPKHLQSIAQFTLKEACRMGAKGAVYDAALYFNELGFSLADIEQTVHFWWGTKDNAVIRLHSTAVEQYVKNNVMYYKEGEGHLSVYIQYFEEAIEVISHSHT